MATTSTALSPAERDFIISGLSENPAVRLDGRALLAPRPIAVSYGEAPQASGSSKVVIGATEVIAGIRLEVVDVDPSAPRGKEGWRGKVEIDATPQAFPQLSSSALSLISTQYANVIAEHFIPSVPAIPILAPTKYFVPHLHLTLVSSSGSPLTALVIAARAAFLDLRIPSTKRIGWEETTTTSTDGVKESDLSGIKAAVRAGRVGGKGKARAAVRGDEWDLDFSSAGGRGVGFLEGREKLPVLITLHLAPNSNVVFLDATMQEESACPARVHCFFTGEGRLCGLRMEGGEAIESERIKPLLLEGKRIAAELIPSLNAGKPIHP